MLKWGHPQGMACPTPPVTLESLKRVILGVQKGVDSKDNLESVWALKWGVG